MSEVVFQCSPFVFKAYGYERPKRLISGHWINREYGYPVFNSGNIYDRFIYIELKGQLYKATPEFIDDTVNVKNWLSLFE